VPHHQALRFPAVICIALTAAQKSGGFFAKFFLAESSMPCYTEATLIGDHLPSGGIFCE
jgi:hypothetical protein